LKGGSASFLLLQWACDLSWHGMKRKSYPSYLSSTWFVSLRIVEDNKHDFSNFRRYFTLLHVQTWLVPPEVRLRTRRETPSEEDMNEDQMMKPLFHGDC